jgi:hypothetical protein
MSTPAQVLANQENAKKSRGATSATGRTASSENRRAHGLSSATYACFFFLETENKAEFEQLERNLIQEHAPQTTTEKIIVRRMAEHEWLRARALRLQAYCTEALTTGQVVNEKHFALYLRYETTHERAFYRCLNELQKLRNQKTKEQIGFVSQKRAAELHEMKKETFEWKKSRVKPATQPEKPIPTTEKGPLEQQMAA